MSHLPIQISPRREEILQILCGLLVGTNPCQGQGDLTNEDWSNLVSLATRERVAPVLYMALKTNAGVLSIPSAILDSLKALLRANQIRNLSFQHDLADNILPVLEGKVSPVVVLKGGALAFTLYPNPALRPLGDLDILIRPDHLDLAEQSLREIGFQRDTIEVSEGFAEFNIHHLHLRRGTPRPLILEVHHRLRGSPADWYSVPLDWFWSQIEPYTIPNSQGGVTTALTFNPTANLLYLSSHLMLFHGEVRSQLIWFYDLHLILEVWRDRIDWNLLVKQARDFEWAPAVSAALKGIQKRFGSQVPSGVIEELDAFKQDRAAAWVKMRTNKFFLDQAVGRWMVFQSKDWRGRFKVLRAFLFPSRDYIFSRHHPRPAWLWPLYYPYRWGYMLRDAGLALWKLKRGR